MAKDCFEKTFFATYTRVYFPKSDWTELFCLLRRDIRCLRTSKIIILLWKSFRTMFILSLVRCRYKIAAMRSLNSASMGKRPSAEQAWKLLVECAETMLQMTPCQITMSRLPRRGTCLSKFCKIFNLLFAFELKLKPPTAKTFGPYRRFSARKFFEAIPPVRSRL